MLLFLLESLVSVVNIFVEMLIDIWEVAGHKLASKHLTGLWKDWWGMRVIVLWDGPWIWRIWFLAKSSNHLFLLSFIQKQFLFLISIGQGDIRMLFKFGKAVGNFIKLILYSIFLTNLKRLYGIVLWFKRHGILVSV